MEVVGTIKVINTTQEVSASFKKRELVVTTDEQYPQHIMIEFTQDKCDLLDRYRIGEEVRVSINLRGREWTNPAGETKYFNSIQGWRIEGRQNQPQSYSPAPTPEPESAVEKYMSNRGNFNEEEHDDLPF
jgi:hypothetical protein